MLVFVTSIQHSPSGKYFTRAQVPDNVPDLLQPLSGLVSFQPRENVSVSKYSVMSLNDSSEIISGTSGRPSMEATNLAISAGDPHHAPAPERRGMLFPP